jgi:1-deoxy-D-xylulose-5-phosphate synthase
LPGQLSSILSKISGPEDIKRLDQRSLEVLAKEIRSVIVETVAKNGGHLGSNLGVVELTIALHMCFSSPRDKIVWDVGHQTYTHKLLTGRYRDFGSLRQRGGYFQVILIPKKARTMPLLQGMQVQPSLLLLEWPVHVT